MGYQPLAAQCSETRLPVGTPAGFLRGLPDFFEPQNFREQAEKVGQVPADARRSRPNLKHTKAQNTRSVRYLCMRRR